MVDAPALESLLNNPPKKEQHAIIEWAKKIIAAMGPPNEVRRYTFGWGGSFQRPFTIKFFHPSILGRKAVARTPRFNNIKDKRFPVYMILFGILVQKGANLRGIWDFFRDLKGKHGEREFSFGKSIAHLV